MTAYRLGSFPLVAICLVLGCSNREEELRALEAERLAMDAQIAVEQEEVKEPETAVDRAIRHAQITTRFGLLRTTTPMKEGPQEDILGALLMEHTPSTVGYIASAQGSALGFFLSGEGEALGESMADKMSSLLEPSAGAMVRKLGGFADWKNLRFEMTLGSTSILRAGVSGIDKSKAQAVLEMEGVPAAEIERLLSPAVDGVSHVTALDVVSDGKRLGLGVSVQFDVAPDGLEDSGATADASPLVVERIAGWDGVSWIRRPGLRDLKLVDWQNARGMNVDAATRLGAMHGFLGVDGPDHIGWEAGKAGDSALYFYNDKR